MQHATGSLPGHPGTNYEPIGGGGWAKRSREPPSRQAYARRAVPGDVTSATVEGEVRAGVDTERFRKYDNRPSNTGLENGDEPVGWPRARVDQGDGLQIRWALPVVGSNPTAACFISDGRLPNGRLPVTSGGLAVVQSMKSGVSGRDRATREHR